VCWEQKFKGGIIWCYSEKTAVAYKGLFDLKKDVQYHKDVPNKNFENVQGKPCLIILADLLTEVYSEDVCVLFTRGTHRRNTSVMLITQNLFHQGLNCRDISLNANYFVLFKNVRDKGSFPIWRIKCSPKTVLVCLRRILTQRKELTVICCWI